MELSFGQRIDPETNLIEPWLTHSALDEIKAMDLSDKNVLMYGAGMGDSWLAKRCKHLCVIERNETWLEIAATSCNQNGVANVNYFFRPCADSDGQAEYYLEFPKWFEPDVIISDDAYRTEAVRKAIDYFEAKEGGGVLICDNFWQDYVWKSPIVNEWIEPYQKHIHVQLDHRDHEGDGWKTILIFIP